MSNIIIPTETAIYLTMLVEAEIVAYPAVQHGIVRLVHKKGVYGTAAHEFMHDCHRDLRGYIILGNNPIDKATGKVRTFYMELASLDDVPEGWWAYNFGKPAIERVVCNPYVYPGSIERWQIIATVLLARFPSEMYPIIDTPANLNQAPQGGI